MYNPHTFHIPVMGLGFTIDTPIKVAHYGISSVMSIGDDVLTEKMREHYCNLFNKPFKSVATDVKDYAAKRITEYLNLVDDIINEKLDALKNSAFNSEEVKKYLSLLPDNARIKQLLNNESNANDVWQKFTATMQPGSADINILTKVDVPTEKVDGKFVYESGRAHIALKGYAESKLSSSLVLSAGLNPRLYSYIAQFNDFFPNEKGEIKKRIILKVSDYRSALIQGKFLAKKGIWVSEYRIESGLNCGGHAFATDGYLMGPILEEFKVNRNELISEITDLYINALQNDERTMPAKPLDVKFSAQGGVGTAAEHELLLSHYQLDSIGWGSLFLLVPEATSLDKQTIQLLCDAKEDDLYLSGISPMGVPFNNVRGTTKEMEKQERIDKNRPGSPCIRKYLSFNTEFSEDFICTASSKYQKHKIAELDSKELVNGEYEKEYQKIVEKECICTGLSTPPMYVNGIEVKGQGNAVSVCPGPNIAYYDKEYTLATMADHIYGRDNIMLVENRPHMFIKELEMYVKYHNDMLAQAPQPMSDKDAKYFETFRENLIEGIEYYKKLVFGLKTKFEQHRDDFCAALDKLEMQIISDFQLIE